MTKTKSKTMTKGQIKGDSKARENTSMTPLRSKTFLKTT
jgi:hypothetical protein